MKIQCEEVSEVNEVVESQTIYGKNCKVNYTFESLNRGIELCLGNLVNVELLIV